MGSALGKGTRRGYGLGLQSGPLGERRDLSVVLQSWILQRHGVAFHPWKVNAHHDPSACGVTPDAGAARPILSVGTSVQQLVPTPNRRIAVKACLLIALAAGCLDQATTPVSSPQPSAQVEVLAGAWVL